MLSRVMGVVKAQAAFGGASGRRFGACVGAADHRVYDRLPSCSTFNYRAKPDAGACHYTLSPDCFQGEFAQALGQAASSGLSRCRAAEDAGLPAQLHTQSHRAEINRSKSGHNMRNKSCTPKQKIDNIPRNLAKNRSPGPARSYTSRPKSNHVLRSMSAAELALHKKSQEAGIKSRYSVEQTAHSSAEDAFRSIRSRWNAVPVALPNPCISRPLSAQFPSGRTQYLVGRLCALIESEMGTTGPSDSECKLPQVGGGKDISMGSQGNTPQSVSNWKIGPAMIQAAEPVLQTNTNLGCKSGSQTAEDDVTINRAPPPANQWLPEVLV